MKKINSRLWAIDCILILVRQSVAENLTVSVK